MSDHTRTSAAKEPRNTLQRSKCKKQSQETNIVLQFLNVKKKKKKVMRLHSVKRRKCVIDGKTE